jgi:hypothetical protein
MVQRADAHLWRVTVTEAVVPRGLGPGQDAGQQARV